MGKKERNRAKQSTAGKRGRRPAISQLKGAAKASAKAAWARKVIRAAQPKELHNENSFQPAPPDDASLQSILALPVSPEGPTVPIAVLRDADVRTATETAFAAEREDILASEPRAILNDRGDAYRKQAKDGSRRVHEWPHNSGVYTTLSRRVHVLAALLGCEVRGSAPLSSLPPPKKALSLRRRQVKHLDFDKAKTEAWRARNTTWPWTVLVALDDYARIVVQVDGKDMVVLLRKGDAAVFRGDIMHGGLGYCVLNVRAHFYLEPQDCDSALREQDGALALHEIEGGKDYKAQRPPVSRYEPRVFSSVEQMCKFLVQL